MEAINDSKKPTNFIKEIIDEDLKNKKVEIVHTRFPPEPNGYLHIGHAKAICINFGIAKEYGGLCNLRFDDTNPIKEDVEYVESIKRDIKWLGFDWEDRLYFASDYFERMYECAVELIKKERAFVCDLSADEIREYRGDFKTPGKESPYRNRSVEENLELFEKMRSGEFENGEKVLRAKIDMTSPNLNLRDPVIYRISHVHHHNTGDKWCIYPMYDYAHPLEDAFENISHSLCSLEFEDHRPLYNWVLEELGFENPPQQIEFARLGLTGTVMSKRYLRNLVEEGFADGWDDPRMPTLSGLRRRGYTPEAIRTFCDEAGVSKSNSTVDMAMLEHFVRDDLKLKAPRIMGVIDPLKVTITNYLEGEIEYLTALNNQENEEMGSRQIPFGRNIYIEREDFMEDAPKKFFRLAPGKEVRLKNAYFIKCEEVIKDEEGNVIELKCTYDPETKSGSGFTGRKVKGTLHWVSADKNVKANVNLYDRLLVEGEETTEEGEYNLNPDSLMTMENCYIEETIKDAEPETKYQFFRHGYFVIDMHSTKDNVVFNRIVSMKDNKKKK